MNFAEMSTGISVKVVKSEHINRNPNIAKVYFHNMLNRCDISEIIIH